MVSLCTYDRKKFDIEMTAEDYNKIRYCDFNMFVFWMIIYYLKLK